MGLSDNTSKPRAAPFQSVSTPPEPTPKSTTPSLGRAASPPYVPKLSELVALLQFETQLVIEHLAQPQLRLVTPQAPSASFVKIERMTIEMPIRLLVKVATVSNQDLAKVPALNKTFTLSDDTSLDARVLVLGPQVTDTTKDEGKLRIEFSIAAK